MAAFKKKKLPEEAPKLHVLLNLTFFCSYSFCFDDDFRLVLDYLPITRMHPATTRELSHVSWQKLAKHILGSYGAENAYRSDWSNGTVRVLYYRQQYEQRVVCRRYDWRFFNSASRAVSFRRFRIIVKNDCYLRHVCLSACNNSPPTRRIFVKFDIWVFFENLPRKFKFHEDLSRITYVHLW